jgi:cell division transport system permease protein
VRSLLFLLREFGDGLSKNRFLHLTYGAQVTISLLVLGIFFVLLVGAAVMWNKLGDAMEIHVFLDDTMSSVEINGMENQLRALDHVKEVTFRSKEEALQLFARQNKAIPLEDLNMDNPLPASYIIQVDRPSNIKAVVGEIDTLNGIDIDNIRYGEQVLDKYIKVLAILVGICVVTMGLLILFTYSSINNIIGLSIYARRAEIRIMQLVGATWWFIRWPFLFEGLFFGITGALLAMGIIALLLFMMAEALRMSNLTMALPALGVTQSDIFMGLAALLLGLGAVVGFFGSLRTVNTFLHRESNAHLEAVKVRQLAR